MRKGDYKAVCVAKPYGSGAWQLYNAADDPGETLDLSKNMPDLLFELEDAWKQYSKEVGIVPAK